MTSDRVLTGMLSLGLGVGVVMLVHGIVTGTLSLTIVFGMMLFASLLVAHMRGWRWTANVSVVVVTLLIATADTNQSYSREGFALALVTPAIFAAIFLPWYWSLSAFLVSFLSVMLRVDDSAALRDPAVLALFGFVVGGIIMISSFNRTSKRVAEQHAVEARHALRRAEAASIDLKAQLEETERLKQTEIESRQRLEQIVATYLVFVQQVGRGDLNQKMDIQHEGVLGKLGAELNHMVESLESSAQAEQQAKQKLLELQRVEAESRQRLEQAVDEYLIFVQKVAEGDLTQRLAIAYEGALGNLGQGLNNMVEGLQQITKQVLQASSDIASAAAEILSSTTQQSSSATEQLAAITQTTTTIEEVKAIAQQTAQQASQVAKESQEMLVVAHEGTQAIEETLHGMGQIRERVEGIAQTILNLSEQAQSIDAIVTLVSELADQSNLLALNAAIEAARAGEQGRSFSVVAQHVRELAERSKGATNQVREILTQIQQSTNQAVMVTEEGTKGVMNGGHLAGQAGQVIHRIAVEVESGAQANVQMVAAAQQQTIGMEQIGQAMSAIQHATTQTLSSTRRAEQAARNLHLLSQSLQQSILAYRL